MVSDGTSDGPEPLGPLHSHSSHSRLLKVHSRVCTRAPREGVELNRISLNLGSELEYHHICCNLVAKDVTKSSLESVGKSTTRKYGSERHEKLETQCTINVY